MQNRTPLLGLLALTGAGVFMLAYAVREPEASRELILDGSRESSTETSPVQPLRRSTEARTTGLARASESAASQAPRIRCLSSVDRSPVAGVWLYRGKAAVAGPSDAEGVLTVEEPEHGKHTLWAPGWVPTTVYAAALAEECLLEVSDAAIELRLLNFSGEHRVLRTLLQPRNSSVPAEGEWSPDLAQAELDTLTAERVAPGAYDLYVWVTYERADPQVYSRSGIELQGGELTRVEIDIAGELEDSPSAELSDNQ